MLIGDTFFPLFGLDQDRICFISEIALDCAMVNWKTSTSRLILILIVKRINVCGNVSQVSALTAPSSPVMRFPEI